MNDAAAPDPILDPLGLYDEEGEINRPFVEAVERAIADHDAKALLELVGDLHEADVGGLIEALDHEDRPRLIELMGREFDFAALIEVDDSVREEILEELPTETVAEGMRDLESDDAVAILEDLDREDQAEILDAMSPVDRAALQRSLDYPEYSAGRLMQTTLLTAPPFWTAGQTLDHIHDANDDDLPDSFFEVFVVDPAHHLLGNVFLDALVRAKRSARLDELMSERHSVYVTEDQEEVARVFERRARRVVGRDVHVVGLLDGHQRVRDLGVRDAVADAQAREPGPLAEGAHDDQVGQLRHERGGRGHARELGVGLVYHQDSVEGFYSFIGSADARDVQRSSRWVVRAAKNRDGWLVLKDCRGNVFRR